VGIVEDGKYNRLIEEQQPAMFVPFLQTPSSQTYFVVHSGRDRAQLVAAIRNTVRDLDAGLPLYNEPSKRLKELGIRIALGAQRKEVLQAALGRALKLLAFGSAAGLLLGILASRVLAAIVFRANPSDPLVLTCAVLAMASLGLVATWIPAQRALSIDPAILPPEE
jgi:hypothetical protein